MAAKTERNPEKREGGFLPEADPLEPDMNIQDSFVMFKRPVERREAVMVLDLCGSSRLSGEDEHMALHLKKRLMQIATPVLNAREMQNFTGTGDGFLATFPGSRNAVSAGAAILGRLRDRNSKTANPPIHIRIALHIGTVYSMFDGENTEIHGTDVNIAFRVEGLRRESFGNLDSDLPREDRVLCTQAFRDDLENIPSPPALDFISCGEVPLKGIPHPVHVYWIPM